MNPRINKIVPALYGGLVTAGIAIVPGLNFINCCCCAGIALGGFLSVFFYRESMIAGDPPLTNDDCLQLGIYAGFIATVAGTLMSVLIFLFFGNVALEVMIRMMDSMNLDLPDQVRQILEESLAETPTPVSVSFSFFISLFVNVIFSALGGLLGWAVYKNKTEEHRKL